MRWCKGEKRVIGAQKGGRGDIKGYVGTKGE
jgi:hypothetical protein